MYYYPLMDMQNTALAMAHGLLRVAHLLWQGVPTPFGPFNPHGIVEAQTELFTLMTRLHSKPSFNIRAVKFRGEAIAVREKVVFSSPFCSLLHFERSAQNPDIAAHMANDPVVLIVTPMSGHFATLMRGTVEAMLPSHNVYITDWVDARNVPTSSGSFDLEDQIELLMALFQKLGAPYHVVAISQASVSALCATALLAAQEKAATPPCTLTMIGGPIDTRSQTVPLSECAATHSLSWFRGTQIQMIPPFYPGAFRRVYPGAFQLLDRMAMSFDRHITEQIKYYNHLVRGDDDAAEVHEKFYGEFLTVMDVPEEFYLQYIERTYQRHDLARGTFCFRGTLVDLAAITRTALLTVEGELDDLSPAGHTRAALDLCPSVPAEKKMAHLEIGVGHYGVFNGRKWRNNIQPLIHKFIRQHIPE